MKLKFFLLVALSLWVTLLHAQWVGPSNNLLKTTNNVNLLSTLSIGTPNAPLPPAILSIQSDQPQGVTSVISINHFGTNFEMPITLLNTSLYCKRANGSEALQLLPLGNLTLTTDGNTTSNRGFFIKSPSADILSITSTALTYTGNVILKGGDLILRDNNDNIQYRVYSDGLVRAREVKVNLNVIPPDYVFEDSYKLMPINELERFITINKHLPNVPSAQEFTDNGGVEISTMQFKLLEKVEELTLYLIELKKENEALKQRICALEQK